MLADKMVANVNYLLQRKGLLLKSGMVVDITLIAGSVR
jgi:hypothetical protein